MAYLEAGGTFLWTRGVGHPSHLVVTLFLDPLHRCSWNSVLELEGWVCLKTHPDTLGVASSFDEFCHDSRTLTVEFIADFANNSGLRLWMCPLWDPIIILCHNKIMALLSDHHHCQVQSTHLK